VGAWQKRIENHFAKALSSAILKAAEAASPANRGKMYYRHFSGHCQPRNGMFFHSVYIFMRRT
jgi:hypothetical protein